MDWKIIAVFLTVYFVYGMIITGKIKESPILDKPKKNLNIILLWVIPFIWGLIVLAMIKPSNTSHADRKKLSKRQRYHESGYSNYTKWGA
jgi:hypothetical protein